MSVLIDLLQICPAIDLTLCVKTLFSLGCSISQIHISLAGRFACLEDKLERKEILKVLRMLGFVTQHTVDIPVVCLNLDKDLHSEGYFKGTEYRQAEKTCLGGDCKRRVSPCADAACIKGTGVYEKGRTRPRGCLFTSTVYRSLFFGTKNRSYQELIRTHQIRNSYRLS